METLASLPDSSTPPAERVGWLVRHTHPAGFRSGEWAAITTVGRVAAPGLKGPAPTRRVVYVVEFHDGVTDAWAVEDPSEPYEFAVVVA